jgi:CheY-like chemotaxis protein
MSVSVLLVDDDREAVTALASLLRQIGCDVSSTFDPRLALAVARTCKPAITFIGLRMSDMTGSYLASMLREEKALDDCALVALSKLGSEHGWLSVRADFEGILSKPATLDEVSAAVEVFAG